MSVLLADGNVLVALTVQDHVHHRRATQWFERNAPDLATCPITEGTLLRFLMREGWPARDAVTVLESFRAQPWHRFWPDAIPYTQVNLAAVIGHRQVTDAYLVALARHNGGQVATLDRGLAVVHKEDVHLLDA
jgi:toxin-antitoxin system PIN domain toxin